MTPPDLADPVQRAAYRRELRGIARPARYGGVGLAIVAALLVALRTAGTIWISDPVVWALVGLAFVLMAIGVVQRTRFHAQRMRG